MKNEQQSEIEDYHRQYEKETDEYWAAEAEHAISPDDICNVEPSDRVNYWNVVLYAKNGEELFTLSEQRSKLTAETIARRVALLVLSWMEK